MEDLKLILSTEINQKSLTNHEQLNLNPYFPLSQSETSEYVNQNFNE